MSSNLRPSSLRKMRTLAVAAVVASLASIGFLSSSAMAGDTENPDHCQEVVQISVVCQATTTTTTTVVVSVPTTIAPTVNNVGRDPQLDQILLTEV
jgi:hypothetical protein